MTEFKRWEHCRLCNGKLELILDLGTQALSGIFPKEPKTEHYAPLEFMKCAECGLCQLSVSVDKDILFKQDYGYRSGMNQTMTNHLSVLANDIWRCAEFVTGDIIVDIGSNDSTFLNFFRFGGTRLHTVGFEPSNIGVLQKDSGMHHIVPDYFSYNKYRELDYAKPKVVTATAMLYDLDNPIDFCQQVHSILADDGWFVLEVAYLPKMLTMVAFDAICHEHIMYYSLSTLHDVIEAAGFDIYDIYFNDINGGSVRIMCQKSHLTNVIPLEDEMDAILAREALLFDNGSVFRSFELDVNLVKNRLLSEIYNYGDAGQRIYAYGASTKGNVLLQSCGITKGDVIAIADKNPEKYGRFTPGTHIPIISEEEMRAAKPNQLLILPWAFKKEFLEREKELWDAGVDFIFPVPTPHRVGKNVT